MDFGIVYIVIFMNLGSEIALVSPGCVEEMMITYTETALVNKL